MSLSSYPDLRESIQDWTQREDIGQNIDAFIALVEADLNRRLRVKDMLTRDTFAASSQYTALPSDYLEMDRLTITSTTPDKELRFLTPQMMSGLRKEHSESGEPIYYSIVEDNVELLPSPADSYTLERLYFARVAALTATNTTNWIITNHPDIYLHGCLHHAYAWAMDESRSQFHKALYEDAVEKVRNTDRNARAGQRPVMRTKTFGG